VQFADADSSNYVAFKAPSVVGSNVTWTLPSADGGSGQFLSTNGTGTLSWASAAAAGGDVSGPASATDNAIARFNLTTGKIIQNSLVTIADDGAITAPQVGSMIPFYYATQAAFPSATTSHGALAHSHADGAMFFAHGGSWVRILDNGGPLGTPSSGTLTNCISIPVNQATGTLPIANGGTGQTTANTAFNALAPLQTSNSGKYLTTDGTNTSWATVSGGGSPGGAPTNIQFNSSSTFGGSANLTWDGTNVQIGATGALRFADTDSSHYVAFKSPGTVATNVTWTLPATDGTSNQALVTNGSAVLSWASVSSTVADGCIYLNNLTINSSYTIAASQGAMSVGPITVASGATVTVSSGSRYVVF